MTHNDSSTPSDEIKLTVQPGCTHVPPGSKHPCMVYGCPGPAPTTMSAAVAGIERIGELEAEVAALRDEVDELAQQNSELWKGIAHWQAEVKRMRPVVEAARDTNNWLKRTDREGTAHQRALQEALDAIG